MTTLQLKLLALGLMIADHVGLYLVPDNYQLRLIGRLSFPIFAWFFVQGYTYTSNWKQYFSRLLFVALITQPIVYLSGVHQLNILFLFVYCLLLLKVLEQLSSTFSRSLLIVTAIILAQLLHLDYGAYGVAIILLFSFHELQESGNLLWLISWVFVNFCSALIISPIQPLAACSLYLIKLVKPEKLKVRPSSLNRLFFYFFYPFHLAAIVCLKSLVHS